MTTLGDRDAEDIGAHVPLRVRDLDDQTSARGHELLDEINSLEMLADLEEEIDHLTKAKRLRARARKLRQQMGYDQ